MNRRRTSDQGTIALFAPTLEVGGVERVTINLAIGFERAGYEVDLLLGIKRGKLLSEVPESINIVELSYPLPYFSVFPNAIIKTIGYLRRRRPETVIGQGTTCNLTLLVAAEFARFNGQILITEHNNPPTDPALASHLSITLARQFYDRADEIIAVSNGVATTVSDTFDLPQNRVTTIYNPVVTQTLHRQKTEPVNHDWFEDDSPVITSLGRMVEQKDFPTLLRAITRIPEELNCRFFIMGSGPLLEKLQTLASSLGIKEEVEFTGYIENPYKYMYQSEAFATSSKREGLQITLIEALACGCPIVSTDCPSGPREILSDGKYGQLVPVGDSEALATALTETIRNPQNSSHQMQRAEDFTIGAATERYRSLIE